VVSPLFLAGAFWGDDIIQALLGEEWMPVAFLFRALCLAQLTVSITTLSSAVHTATGRAHWVLYFYIACVVSMPAAIYAAAQFGLNAVALPWVTLYPVIAVAWTGVTLRKLGLSWWEHVQRAGAHVLAALAVVAGVNALFFALGRAQVAPSNYVVRLVGEVVVAGVCYCCYLWFRERQTVLELWSLRKA
jgi:O-antigen/teichoic acid export membrane protein